MTAIIEQIKSRNSNAMISDQAVEPELIEQILDCAVCTPVHYDTKPWRFAVIEGDGRHKFGQFMADYYAAQMDDTSTDEAKAFLAKIKTKPLRAPVIICVAAAKSDNPKALHIEDVASATVACQNILLAADSLGLSAIWRTGSLTYSAEVVEFLGFDQGSSLVGFIYIGHGKCPPYPKKRDNAKKYTHWLK